MDDHAGFRSWAREVLEQEGFRVVGEAWDGGSAIDTVRALRPEVVLLDVLLPDMSGFDVAERLRGEALVVLTSSAGAADFGPRLYRTGALGFLPKADLTGASLERLIAGGGR